MDGIDDELKPTFTYGSNSARPCVMPDGAIIFVSEILAKETAKATQELFLYKNGEFKRLTQLDSWIHQATTSSDGKYVMFSKESGKNSDDSSIWLMKNDGTGLREVKVPPDLLKQ
jgi:dipeptidyl aminopeptidase/acylaminoacyl peptidase